MALKSEKDIIEEGKGLAKSTNFNKLKKYAKDNEIDISDCDLAPELQEKITNFVNNFVNNKKNKKTVVIFTYAPNSSDSPKHIKFMDKIDFTEGQPVKIIDDSANESIIFKLKGNPSFVEGEHDFSAIKDIIRTKQHNEAERVKKIKSEDNAIQVAYNKHHMQ